MRASAIPLVDKIKETGGMPWHPVEVAKVNNQIVRLAMFKGEYHWHKHDAEDELFYVVKVKVIIQPRPPGKNITLKNGQFAVVRKASSTARKAGKAHMF